MATVNRHCGNADADADAGGFAGCTLRYIMEADGDVITICLACVQGTQSVLLRLIPRGRQNSSWANHLWAISAQTNNLSLASGHCLCNETTIVGI